MSWEFFACFFFFFWGGSASQNASFSYDCFWHPLGHIVNGNLQESTSPVATEEGLTQKSTTKILKKVGENTDRGSHFFL